MMVQVSTRPMYSGSSRSTGLWCRASFFRLPLRGMLGNGLRVVVGAVAASEGSLVVETRGHRLTLAVDPVHGTTTVTEDRTDSGCAGIGRARHPPPALATVRLG